MAKRAFDGWTLVGPLGGFVLCGGEPMFWKLKVDAQMCREGEMQLCRAKVTMVGNPLPLTKREKEEG